MSSWHSHASFAQTSPETFFARGPVAPEPLPADAIYPRGRQFPFTFFSVGGTAASEEARQAILVRVRGDGFTGVLSGMITAEGTYEIAGLSPGSFRVYVMAGHGPRQSTSLLPEGDAVVTIADDPLVSHDLVVVPAGVGVPHASPPPPPPAAVPHASPAGAAVAPDEPAWRSSPTSPRPR